MTPRDWDLAKDYVLANYPDEKKMVERMRQFRLARHLCKPETVRAGLYECLDRLDYMSKIVIASLGSGPGKPYIHSYIRGFPDPAGLF